MKKSYLTIAITSLICLSCFDNNPKSLIQKGEIEFSENQEKFNRLVDVLSDLSTANKGVDAHLFVQSKQAHIDYSEENDGFKNPPITISNQFIIDANNIGVDDIWMNSNYYKFRDSENSSTEYTTYYIYIKNEYNNPVSTQKQLQNKNWVVEIKKK